MAKNLFFNKGGQIRLALLCSGAILIGTLQGCQFLPPAPNPIHPTELSSSVSSALLNETAPAYTLPKPSDLATAASQHLSSASSAQLGFASTYNPDKQLALEEKIVLQTLKEGEIFLGRDEASLHALAKEINELAFAHHFDLSKLSFIWQSSLDPAACLSLNIEKQHIAASTIKLPLAIIALDAVAAGDFNLQTKIAYQESDFEGGAGILSKPKIGETFTLKKLLELSIVHSDNIATNMILRWVKTYTSTSALEQIHQRFGIPVGERENKASVTAMLLSLKELNLNPKQNPYYHYLQTWLREATTTFLGKSWPTDYSFQHKYGLYLDTYGEVIFGEGKHPFYLTLYWQNANQNTSNEQVLNFLDQLGQIFFNYSSLQN